MSKTRPLSIYLLKKSHSAANALKDNHDLKDKVTARTLPDGASLFILDNPATDPWWKTYFGIEMDIKQASKGAIVFLPVGERCFALCFGHVNHKLKDESFEYDFGLRVTLNCVDPDQLKSTDTLEPGTARRRRTQIAVGSDLTFFDFDRDSSILKGLTGKVRPEHKDLFKTVTGGSSLVINSAVSAEDLVGLCEKLLALYENDTYLTTFPDIQNIAPVRDPAIVDQLNEKLVQALREKDESLYLAIPEIVDYQSVPFYASFSGVGSSLVYDEVFLDKYYEYLESKEQDLSTIGYDDLKKHRLVQTLEDGTPRAKHYSILNCLVFDTTLCGQQTYHLAEGKWYKVENAYLEKIKAFLDPLCEVLSFPPYAHESEGQYNESVATKGGTYLCLDKTNISLPKQTEVEPCDLYSVHNGCALFHHIKISTLSNQLSHQFNQGANAIELLKLEPSCIEKLKELITESTEEAQRESFLEPLDTKRFQVIFGIVTHKDNAKKSDNLPLFSRISLTRIIKALRLMDTACVFGFIADQSVPKPGAKKKRKKKPSAAIGTPVKQAAKAS